jgi:predicted ATP-binding protein involved in virulence
MTNLIILEKPMFLKFLRLENIRCIEHLELPLTATNDKPRQWTILLGENGAGKSTVLRSIALVLAGSEALAELIRDTDSWIRHGQSSAEIRAVLTTTKNEEREISLRFERGQSLREMFDTNRETLDALDRAELTSRNYFNVSYGVSRRLSSERSMGRERYSHPRANHVATLFDSSAELVPFEAWAMDLHYRRGTLALELVRTALSDFLPGVEFQDVDKEKRQLLFQTPDGPMPLEMLSDGFQNAISWCGDLLYRITETFRDYQKPLQARGLLLIDEIGLHLHLSWQRRLREFISSKFPNLQIIATTHSPFTAHQAGEGELFSLIREAEGRHSSIKLLPFEGVANRLLLHQLIMTPFFGLNTMNSLEWEELREEYRALDAKKRKSKKDRARIAELEELLADQPDWSSGMPQFDEVKSLLQEIRDTKETP